MKYGYVRVSSKEQNLARQMETMEKAKISPQNIYAEKVSGKDMERPELKKLLNVVKEGDSIVVEDITRLGRNTLDILKIIDTLEQEKVYVISLKEGLDTSSSQGKMMISLLGVFSEMERKNIRERQRQGIEIARREGRRKGRPRCKCEDFKIVYKQYENGDISIQQALKLLDCSKSTFYRRIKEYSERQE